MEAASIFSIWPGFIGSVSGSLRLSEGSILMLRV